MGKKDKNKNKGKEYNSAEIMDFIRSKNWDIEDVQTVLEEIEMSKKISCSHTNSEGKVKIKPIGDSGYLYKCTKCGTVIDLRPIDEQTAKKAMETVINMINQVKLFTADPHADQRPIKELGRCIQNISRAKKVYESIAPGKKLKKNKKKNKHKGYNNGGSDLQGGMGIHFMDASKKHRR